MNNNDAKLNLHGVSESQKQDAYTDEEVNDLAEWFKDLTIKQAFFLKETYGRYLEQQSIECGHSHVH